MKPGSVSSPLLAAPPGSSARLQHHHLPATLGEHVRRHQPIGSGADHDRVVVRPHTGPIPRRRRLKARLAASREGRRVFVATNERFMPVQPEAVWDVLADPGNYGYWVVGSKLIRDADSGWPQLGSKFHHTVGIGPFKISDHTVSLEARPPELLRLRVKARPFVTAIVTMELRPKDGGTLVRMIENPDGLASILAFNPLVQLLTRGRNAESLMRLEELALRKAAARGDRRSASRERAQAPSSV